MDPSLDAVSAWGVASPTAQVVVIHVPQASGLGAPGWWGVPELCSPPLDAKSSSRLRGKDLGSLLWTNNPLISVKTQHLVAAAPGLFSEGHKAHGGKTSALLSLPALSQVLWSSRRSKSTWAVAGGVPFENWEGLRNHPAVRGVHPVPLALPNGVSPSSPYFCSGCVGTGAARGLAVRPRWGAVERGKRWGVSTAHTPISRLLGQKDAHAYSSLTCLTHRRPLSLESTASQLTHALLLWLWCAACHATLCPPSTINLEGRAFRLDPRCQCSSMSQAPACSRRHPPLSPWCLRGLLAVIHLCAALLVGVPRRPCPPLTSWPNWRPL